MLELSRKFEFNEDPENVLNFIQKNAQGFVYVIPDDGLECNLTFKFRFGIQGGWIIFITGGYLWMGNKLDRKRDEFNFVANVAKMVFIQERKEECKGHLYLELDPECWAIKEWDQQLPLEKWQAYCSTCIESLWQGLIKLWEKQSVNQSILERVRSNEQQPTRPEVPQVSASPDNEKIPPLLLNREAMKQYCGKGFTYTPQTAKSIINKLKDAQQLAELEGEKLTVRLLATKVGISATSMSRYLGAMKAAGFDELMGVKLPGQ